MGFNKDEVKRCLINANGNVGMGMVLYIVHNGCGDFKCKDCPLQIVCDHHPENARSYGIKVLAEIEKRAEENDAKQAKK